MPFHPNIHHRHSIRLPGYDYSEPNAYFVTICAYQKEHLFGEVRDGEMRVNALGTIAGNVLIDSIKYRQEIRIDEWIVMPNHIHFIVFIVGAHGNAPRALEPDGRAHYHAPLRRLRSLSTFIAGFKRISTMNIRKTEGSADMAVWQRNYYEHIIRSERDLHAIREYIVQNPMKWEEDPENPSNP